MRRPVDQTPDELLRDLRVQADNLRFRPTEDELGIMNETQRDARMYELRWAVALCCDALALLMERDTDPPCPGK